MQSASAIVPVCALRKLHDDAGKGDESACALIESIAGWWAWARSKMDCEDCGGEVCCASCSVTLIENKVGGFAVLLPPKICAAFCLSCMSRPSTELQNAFAKAISADGLGSLERQQ